MDVESNPVPSYDLDHILIHGDKVYKFQNRNCTLSVDDFRAGEMVFKERGPDC